MGLVEEGRFALRSEGLRVAFPFMHEVDLLGKISISVRSLEGSWRRSHLLVSRLISHII